MDGTGSEEIRTFDDSPPAGSVRELLEVQREFERWASRRPVRIWLVARYGRYLEMLDEWHERFSANDGDSEDNIHPLQMDWREIRRLPVRDRKAVCAARLIALHDLGSVNPILPADPILRALTRRPLEPPSRVARIHSILAEAALPVRASYAHSDGTPDPERCPVPLARRVLAFLRQSFEDHPMGLESQSIEDAEFFSTLVRAVRKYPERFRRGGEHLDSEYGIEAVRSRLLARATECKAVESAATVQAAEDDRRKAENLTLAECMVEAICDLRPAETGVEGGEARPSHASMNVLDGAACEAVLILTWIMFDPEAHAFKPRLCEFQSLPWDFEIDEEAIQASRQLVSDSRLDRYWVQRARLAWAEVDITAEPAQVRESSSMAENDGEPFLPLGFFPKTVRARLEKAIQPDRKQKRVRFKVEESVRLFSHPDAFRWWPNDVPGLPASYVPQRKVTDSDGE